MSRPSEILMDINSVKAWLTEADYMQVVRCKDCEYGDTCEMGVPLDGSIRCDYHGDGYEIHDPYWFCADGKVKQDIIPDRV